MNKLLHKMCVATALVLAAQGAQATCTSITRDQLNNAAYVAMGKNTGGYGLPMWVTMVDETGLVCFVVETSNNGPDTTGRGHSNDEWLGSRIISAQKASTANAFSLDGYAISTANLYTPVQGSDTAGKGGSLYGLQHSNPVDASKVYLGDPKLYGTATDPLAGAAPGKGLRPGGVNVFGGGLAIYKAGVKVGAIGVSGDTSCRDHAFAWSIRKALKLEPTGSGITTVNLTAAGAAAAALDAKTAHPQPAGNTLKGDEMVIPDTFLTDNVYWKAWSHPGCPNTATNESTGADIGVIVTK